MPQLPGALRSECSGNCELGPGASAGWGAAQTHRRAVIPRRNSRFRLPALRQYCTAGGGHTVDALLVLVRLLIRDADQLGHLLLGRQRATEECISLPQPGLTERSVAVPMSSALGENPGERPIQPDASVRTEFDSRRSANQEGLGRTPARPRGGPRPLHPSERPWSPRSILPPGA